MFYQPKDGHPLKYNPFSAIVTPRPIGWISSRNKDGIDNLAPYSFFNAVAYQPPQVMFCSSSRKPDRHLGKDSVANIDETGEFCVNMVGYEMRDVMNATAIADPAGGDEFTHAGIARAACETIACSRVVEAPAALECKLVEIIRLRGDDNLMVIGEVVGVHLRDDCLKDGIFDITHYQPLAR
ncbi:MAG: flavin reductase, partial [Rhodobacterales bacterium]